jgi:hypothetical protein
MSDLALPLRKSDDASAGITVNSIDDIKRISLIFVNSGMFKTDAHATAEEQMYQAGVKIIAGKEFGVAPFAAMRGINIIKGNAEMSANLMAAKVKRHPKYDYRVKQWDNDGCVLEFYEIPHPGAPKAEWELLGESSFNMDDARQAGLAGGDNWRKFARNMFFARAISNGVRIHCPDIFYGAPVYTDGELSGSFESEAETEEVPAEPEASEQAVGEAVPEGEVVQPKGDPMSNSQRRNMMALFADVGISDSEARHSYIEVAIGRTVESSSELTLDEASVVIDWLHHEPVKPTDPQSEPETVTPIQTTMQPKQSAHIYSLGRKLGVDTKELAAQVMAIATKEDADEFIIDLEQKVLQGKS